MELKLLTEKEIIPILNELRPVGFNHIRSLGRNFKRDMIPLLEAQAKQTAREKDKEWIEFLEGCTFASLPNHGSCYLVPHSKIEQLRKQIEGLAKQG